MRPESSRREDEGVADGVGALARVRAGVPPPPLFEDDPLSSRRTTWIVRRIVLVVTSGVGVAQVVAAAMVGRGGVAGRATAATATPPSAERMAMEATMGVRRLMPTPSGPAGQATGRARERVGKTSCMRLWLIGALVVLAGCGEETIRLTLHQTEAREPGAPIPIEGSVQFIELRRAGADAVVVRLEGPRRSVTVPAGHYQVLSYSRPCAGSCEQLGEPAGRCAGAFELRKDRSLTIQTAAGEACVLLQT